MGQRTKESRSKNNRTENRSKVMESKELAKKDSSGALASPADLAGWGRQELSHNDIIIPRILAMQGLSDMVTEGKAKFGDMVENLNQTVLGGINKPIEIIPLRLERVWREVDARDGKSVKAIRPIVSNPASDLYNDDLSFEGEAEDGTPVKRFRSMRFYVLLPSELEEGGALPYMIEFKSTSLRAGKKMATQMYTKNLASGLSPAAKVFVLSLTKEQNDKGTFAVFDVAVDRNSTDDEQSEALKWFKLLGSGAAKVHEEGDDLPPL